MKKLKFFLFYSLLFFALSSYSQSTRTANVDALADLYVARSFEFNPQSTTLLGRANADNAGFWDNSVAGVQKWYAFEDSLLKVLKATNKHLLSQQDAFTYGILLEKLEGDVGCKICRSELWNVNQLGWQVVWRQLANVQPVGTDMNRRNTLERWQRLADFIQNEIDNLKEGLKQGYTAPKQNVKLVMAQVNALLKQSITESYFYLPALRDSTPAFAQALQQVIEQQIYPQLLVYRDFLTKEYLDKARESLSLSSLPNGKACYKALLRKNTTLSIAPDEVYAAGLMAVEEREVKVKELGRKLFGTEDLTQIRRRMQQDKTNRFASKEELLAFSNDAVLRAKNKVLQYFSIIPAATIEIRPYPDYQTSTASSYSAGSDDGSVPAVYNIQLFQYNLQDKGDVERVAFHETYPGHHLQRGIARGIVASNPFAKYAGNSAFSEGWGRYAETLADEMGLYTTERNRLSAYSTLPIGMVMDPAIHFKGWTREQAIQYTLDKVPTWTREAAETYVDRIAVLPGQVTTYGIGESFFIRLKSRAKSVLGKRFDIKEFHDRCLESGAIPLNMLEQHILNWLKKTSANN